MSRKRFIESHGATCRNWTWSWSFVNESERFVIFGAWDLWDDGSTSLILSEKWQQTRKGKRSAAYPQSREHIRLVEEEAYRLFTFPMKYSDELHGEDESGPGKIRGFVRELSEKSLARYGADWFAEDPTMAQPIPEEMRPGQTFREGAVTEVRVNAYERSIGARRECIRHYGCSCAVCGFNFGDHFGEIGEGYIHVHHRNPMAAKKAEYEVDPIKDLVPVCPNCHAMLHHKREEPMGIEELQQILRSHE